MNLYQSFIGDSQHSHISDVCIPYDASQNTGGDVREYELFREIHRGRHDDEPWGLISWKFEHKTCVPAPEFRAFCESKLSEGHDCVFINPMIGNEATHFNVWEQGEHCGHKGIKQIAQHLHLCADLDTLGCMGKESFSFCNYFVGTPAFWSAYLTFIDNAMTELKAQAKAGTEVGNIFAGGGNYISDQSASMRIFVIERLFSSFVKTQSEIRCAPFQHTRNIYIKKFGEKLGMLLHQLSLVKQRALVTNDSELMNLWNEMRNCFFSDSYMYAVWQLDDPPEFYLGSQYAKFADRLSKLGLDDS